MFPADAGCRLGLVGRRQSQWWRQSSATETFPPKRAPHPPRCRGRHLGSPRRRHRSGRSERSHSPRSAGATGSASSDGLGSRGRGLSPHCERRVQSPHSAFVPRRRCSHENCGRKRSVSSSNEETPFPSWWRGRNDVSPHSEFVPQHECCRESRGGDQGRRGKSPEGGCAQHGQGERPPLPPPPLRTAERQHGAAVASRPMRWWGRGGTPPQRSCFFRAVAA